jgi:hypothetical protein
MGDGRSEMGRFVNVKVKVNEVRECGGMAPEAWGLTDLGIYVYVYEIFDFFRSRSCRDAGLCVLGKIGIRGGRGDSGLRLRLRLRKIRFFRLGSCRLAPEAWGPTELGIYDWDYVYEREEGFEREGAKGVAPVAWGPTEVRVGNRESSAIKSSVY